LNEEVTDTTSIFLSKFWVSIIFRVLMLRPVLLGLFENLSFLPISIFQLSLYFFNYSLSHIEKLWVLCVLYKYLSYSYIKLGFEYTHASSVFAPSHARLSHSRFDALSMCATLRMSQKLIIYMYIFFDMYNCYSNSHIFKIFNCFFNC
jgi:hypothetical protein